MKKRGNAQIRITLIGDGKMKPALMKRAEQEGLDNCIFLPPMPKMEIAKVTASLDVGLMVLKDVPAFYDGTSPNKFFDYISSGLPVVNNYPGWLASMIEENGCGMAVPPRNAEAFADALEAMAEDPELCRRMGAAARALAEREFSRDRLATRFCEWIEEHGRALSPNARHRGLA